ncbi:MAG: hypothetical protein L3K05_07555, partial [Thermoplasmata archaeon]|nr:hypothetical protein [Thermoplasmata archaeon]
MPGEFCVVCGREDLPTTDGVCADCFAKRTSLLRVEGRPIVVICPTCGARQAGSMWERRGAPTVLTPEDLMPLLVVHPEAGVRRVRWSEGGKTVLLRDLAASADVAIRGQLRTETVKFEVKIEHHT